MNNDQNEKGGFVEIVDARGLNCPEPVLMAKAFWEKRTGESFSILVDNEASRENVLRFGRSKGCEVSIAAANAGEYTIHFTPNSEHRNEKEFQEDEYSCENPQQGNLVYVISSDTMGRGSDELGWALLQTYVTTIPAVAPLPSHILLYNGGVKLATAKGKALETLQSLEKQGVIVWCCGTCLEFFKIEEDRKVGSITNMYDIMSTMASAANLVSPF